MSKLSLRALRPGGLRLQDFREGIVSKTKSSIGMPLRLARPLHSLRSFPTQPCSAPLLFASPLFATDLTKSRRTNHKFHSSPSSRFQHEPIDQTGADSIGAKKRQGRGFSYGLAASYCGKQHRFNPAIHYYSEDVSTSERWLAGQLIDRGAMKGKRTPSGQDACFMSGVGTSGAAAFGVADGVGGWIEQRIDSADFAHGICEYMDDACRRFPTAAFASPSPKDLLHAGYAMVCKDKTIPGGGSTACLAIADHDGTMSAANLGDSGFMHIRLNKVHYVSEHQTHAFNTPFQLSKMPYRMLMQIKEYGGESPISDYPKDANVTQHTLRHGDVLLFATDGVWDNLSSQDLLEVVSERMTSIGAWNNDDHSGVTISKELPALTHEPPTGLPKSIQAALATAVVEKAKAASMNVRRDSPFAKAVQRQFPSERFSGGKVDDICVVVVVVIDGNGALEI